MAERVARYRRRKSRVQGVEDKVSSNLEFNFDRSRDKTEAGRSAARRVPGDDEFDAVLGSDADSRAQIPPRESIAIEGNLPSFRAEAGDVWSTEPAGADMLGPAPLEIVLGDDLPEEEQPETTASDEVRLAAPIGRRLAAGLVDAMVLLIAACVFTLVFAQTGGEVEPQASDVTIIILGLGAASLATFYFALFTALAFATPGQSALGLRVRTLDNRLPGTSTAMWRGVGYLVSAAALMLGFIWAVFDSQGLTWHDHMSGTCLVLRRDVTVDS
jgi:uncharacterized RDD family membrane protein YckC